MTGDVILDDWASGLTDAELAAVLPHVWDLWGTTKVVPVDRWRRLFRRIGWSTVRRNVNTGELTDLGLARPTTPVTLYRGSWARRAHGMSWTPSLRLAASFSNGWRIPYIFPERVFRTDAPPDAILAIQESVGCAAGVVPGAIRRYEATEYIVDPDRLGEIEVVE